MAQLESTKESPAVNAYFQVSDREQLEFLYNLLSDFLQREIDKDKCDPDKYEEFSNILNKHKEIARYFLADISTVLFMNESLDDIREYMRDLYIKSIPPEEVKADIAAKLGSLADSKELGE